MHWVGPKGCQAKKIIVNLPSAIWNVECAMYLHLINSNSHIGPEGWGFPSLGIACHWQCQEGYIVPAKRHGGLIVSAGSSATATSLG